MSTNATVFLGGGRITSALAAGLRLGGYDGPIVVYDRNLEKLRALKRESKVEIVRDLPSGLALAEDLIIAVRPSSVAELLSEVEALKHKPKLCVSLAAGIPLKELSSLMKSSWARAMPSPVSRIGLGLTALTFAPEVPGRSRRRLQAFFSHVGKVVEIPERQFDAFTATYSSSHGYHALAALAKAAQKSGLDRKTALLAAAHALGDGIRYWRQSGANLDELLAEAVTPGGIAAATIFATNHAGYEQAVAKGLRAGIARARRNARDSRKRRT